MTQKDLPQWRRAIAAYREPSRVRSLAELVLTTVGLVVCWAALYNGVRAGYPMAWLLVVPAAGFVVRLFMIQHDCSHRSFFRSPRANDWVGRAIGVITLTPHDFWRYTHNQHHANSGNLDRSELGAINTLTVAEYRALSRLQRLGYRVYRHPLVMLGLGPAYLFFIDHRLPMGCLRGGLMPWLSTMGTNAAIVTAGGGLIYWLGAGPLLLIQLPVMVAAASIGVWLFYVQHQFETTYWEHDACWEPHAAALRGSSHLSLPPILCWFTANIGIHHVHHLCSRVPFYRLPEVLRDYPALCDVNRITLRESLRMIRLSLWDEDARRLVSFKEAGRRAR